MTMGDPCVQKEKKTERHKKGRKMGLISLLSYHEILMCLLYFVFIKRLFPSLTTDDKR